MAKRGPKPMSPEAKLNRRQRREAARARAIDSIVTGENMTLPTLDQVVAANPKNTTLKTPEELARVQEEHQETHTKSWHIFKENELVTDKPGPKPKLLTHDERSEFLLCLWKGFGRNWAVKKMKVSLDRVRRTITMDEEFASHVAAVEKTIIERCDRVLFVDAMTKGSETRLDSAYRLASQLTQRERAATAQRFRAIETRIKKSEHQAKNGNRKGDARPDLACLDNEESDSFDYLFEKIQLDQEFTAEEALEWVRLDRKIRAAERVRKANGPGHTGEVDA